MYTFRAQSTTLDFVKKTKDVKKALDELAGKLDLDTLAAGTVFTLETEDGLKAELQMAGGKMRLFKNNEDTRSMVAVYMLDQIQAQQKVIDKNKNK